MLLLILSDGTVWLIPTADRRNWNCTRAAARICCFGGCWRRRRFDIRRVIGGRNNWRVMVLVVVRVVYGVGGWGMVVVEGESGM